MLYSGVAVAQHEEDHGNGGQPHVSNTQTPAHDAADGSEHAGEAGHKKFNPGKEMLDHIADSHEFHFFSLEKADGTEFHATLPLPVLLYSPQRGVDFFMSSQFHHGHEAYHGYKMVEHDIIPVNEAGQLDETVKVFDFSLTKNVVQMLIAITILFFLLKGVATSTSIT